MVESPQPKTLIRRFGEYVNSTVAQDTWKAVLTRDGSETIEDF